MNQYLCDNKGYAGTSARRCVLNFIWVDGRFLMEWEIKEEEDENGDKLLQPFAAVVPYPHRRRLGRFLAAWFTHPLVVPYHDELLRENAYGQRCLRLLCVPLPSSSHCLRALHNCKSKSFLV